MKRGWVVFVFLFLTLSLVSAVKCGDNVCDAGMSLSGKDNKIEDASTCFSDCKYVDYDVCEVSIVGGECVFNGETYEISDIDTYIMSNKEIEPWVNFSLNGGFVNAKTGIWYKLAGNVYFSIAGYAISADLEKIMIFFKERIEPELLNDFINIKNSNLNLKSDKNIETTYSFPIKLSRAYCNFSIIDPNNLEIQAGSWWCESNNFVYSLDDFTPGRYSIKAQYFDETVNNKLGEKIIGVKINECMNDNECNDGNFLTRDLCSDTDIKLCENSINYSLILIFIIVLFIIVLVVIWLIKKYRDDSD